VGELSTFRMTVKTPTRGAVPNLGGPKLPPVPWPAKRADRLWLEGYLSSCTLLIWDLAAQRSGPFDLRTESVILTAWHTIARIHRGAA